MATNFSIIMSKPQYPGRLISPALAKWFLEHSYKIEVSHPLLLERLKVNRASIECFCRSCYSKMWLKNKFKEYEIAWAQYQWQWPVFSQDALGLTTDSSKKDLNLDSQLNSIVQRAIHTKET